MNWLNKMKKKLFYADFDEAANKDYRITFNAISVRGERHKRNDEYNQDFFTCNIKNQIKYVIVADGLGSANQSHIGSKQAVELMEQLIIESIMEEDNLSELDMEALNREFYERWKSSFSDYLREYDTTLQYLLILKQGILVGGIGDGLTLYAMKNEVVYKKEEKNNFSNQTYSLASDHALDYFNVFYTPITFADELPIVFIIATDGVSDDLKPDMLDQLPVHLYQELKEKGVIGLQQEIGDWILNWQTKNHSDDRTFCVLTMWKAGEEE
jgi:serine/threonine protein phosphatase PrpC